MAPALLTGFRAFPGVPANPTQTLVEYFRQAPQALPPATRLDLLDVDYRQVGPALDALLAAEPAALVMTGYSHQAECVLLEACATGHCAPDRPDVCGHVPAAPDTLPPPLHTGIDLASLTARLAAEGIAARTSHDAGTYLCNFSYRHALHRVAERGLATQVLFVHLPALSGTALAASSAAHLPLAAMARALALVLAQLVATPRR